MSENANTSTTDTAEQNPMDAFTSRAQDILVVLAAGLTDITARTKELAVVVVDVRGYLKREVTSKSTGKAVVVPDWDGRSPSYREWYKDTFVPLLEKTIPESFHSTIRTRIQNAVQEEAHKRATPAQKKHLGMAAKSKSATQTAKRNGNNGGNTAASNNDRQSEEVFSADALVAHVQDEGTSVSDALQEMLAMARALETRTRNLELPKAEADRCSKLSKQLLDAIISTRSHITPTTAAPSRQKAAATA